MKSHWEKYTDEKSISSLPPPLSPFPYSGPPLHTPQTFSTCYNGVNSKASREAFSTPPSCSGSERCSPSENHSRTELCVHGSHTESKITVNNSRT